MLDAYSRVYGIRISPNIDPFSLIRTTLVWKRLHVERKSLCLEASVNKNT